MKPNNIGSIVVILAFVCLIISSAIYVYNVAERANQNPEYDEYLSIRDYSSCTKENDATCADRSLCVHAYRQCQINACGNDGIGWQTPETSDRICVLGDNGECKVDITTEYQNAETDYGRECGITDQYYETGRYICVKEIRDTNNTYYLARGTDKEVETYFTMIDGNTYIMNSTEMPELKPDHLYSTTSLIQAGYCHGPSKLIRATEISGSCNGGSNCYEIPMGWINGTRTGVWNTVLYQEWSLRNALYRWISVSQYMVRSFWEQDQLIRLHTIITIG